MARDSFVKNLVETLRALGSLTEGILAGESMHCLDLRVGGFNPNKLYKGFENLRRRNIVRAGGNGNYTFTRKGREWIRENQLTYFKTRFKKWDKKWRIVIFDIPQEKSLARQKFRRRLKTLGFHPIQKSVYIFPYPCEEEVGLVAEKLEISDYIDLFIAEFPGFKEKELLKFFDL